MTTRIIVWLAVVTAAVATPSSAQQLYNIKPRSWACVQRKHLNELESLFQVADTMAIRVFIRSNGCHELRYVESAPGEELRTVYVRIVAREGAYVEIERYDNRPFPPYGFFPKPGQTPAERLAERLAEIVEFYEEVDENEPLWPLTVWTHKNSLEKR